ncbi:hypothetical protein C0993_002549, partial [Termitomyces sp. T159_Od127]
RPFSSSMVRRQETLSGSKEPAHGTNLAMRLKVLSTTCMFSPKRSSKAVHSVLTQSRNLRAESALSNSARYALDPIAFRPMARVLGVIKSTSPSSWQRVVALTSRRF